MMAKILIADDNPRDVAVLKDQLKKLGHVVTYCEYSQDAQVKIRRGTMDYAIFDGCLPRYSDQKWPSSEWGGVFLAREARRFWPNLPCVVYTNNLEQDYLDQLEEMGVPVFLKGIHNANDIITKLGL